MRWFGAGHLHALGKLSRVSGGFVARRGASCGRNLCAIEHSLFRVARLFDVQAHPAIASGAAQRLRKRLLSGRIALRIRRIATDAVSIHHGCIGRGCPDWVHRPCSREQRPNAGRSPRGSRLLRRGMAIPARRRFPTVLVLLGGRAIQKVMTQQLPAPATFAMPTREQWMALVEQDLRGGSFEKRLVTQLIEGLTVVPLYTSDDVPRPDSMGLPGQPPFARGSTQLGQVNAACQILPEHRHPLPAQANAAIRSDIEHGADGVVVRLSPRLLGAAMPTAGCGCGGGILVDSVDDFDQLFANVDLSKMSLCLAAGPAFHAAAAQVIALYARRRVAADDMCAQFGADPLGTFAARGTLPRPAETMLAEMATLAELSCSRFPGVRTVTVSTAPYDNAGATAVQELAAALCTGVAYLRAMEGSRLTVVQASQQIQFSLTVGTDQFLEIAKLRAMRLVWNRLLEAAEVPEDHRSMLIHARSSRRVLTQRDPWVNALRTTIGTFAAAVGGADQMTVLPYDDVIGPSDVVAQRLARNTQIILREEGQIGRVLDAAGGSYYVEHLTASLAEAAWKVFQALERRGGMLSVLRDGSFAGEIGAVWQKRAKDFARRKTPITGVSEFPHLGEKPIERPKVDTTEFEAALLRTREQRAANESLRASLSLATVRSGVARLESLVAASEGGATLFALHDVLGNQGESAVAFPLRRFAAAYEVLRDQSDQLLAKRGHRPRIFSANMGPIAQHAARAMYAQNFFEAGGFEVVKNDGFVDTATAAEAFATSGATTVVICSSDAWYDVSACELGSTLKQKGAKRVILAGNPGQNEAKYRESGIDQFVFIGCDVLGTLSELAQNEVSS
jgi:methylmalonyl-CoA mutase